MRVAAFLFTAALVGCAAGRPPAEHPRSGAPVPGPDGYTCSAQQSFQTPPTDAELKQLETACARRGARVPAGVREVNDCPCTQLAAALGYRKDAAARRRGMTLSMQICEAGSYDACDAYELARSLCLRDPSQPECGPLRDRGLIPTTPLPLSRVLGCRAFDEGTLCVERDRLYFKAVGQQWEQARVLGWERDDAPDEARLRAKLPQGTLLLTPTRVVENAFAGAQRGPLADPRGRSRQLTPPELKDARAAIAGLPLVEVACAATDACVRAIDDLLRPPPPSREGEDDDTEGAVDETAPAHPRTLRACSRLRDSTISQLGERAIPAACAPPAPRGP